MKNNCNHTPLNSTIPSESPSTTPSTTPSKTPSTTPSTTRWILLGDINGDGKLGDVSSDCVVIEEGGSDDGG